MIDALCGAPVFILSYDTRLSRVNPEVAPDGIRATTWTVASGTAERPLEMQVLLSAMWIPACYAQCH